MERFNKTVLNILAGISLISICLTQFVKLNGQEMIQNGGFDNPNLPCPTQPCATIGPQCIPPWDLSHGTPQLSSEPCTGTHILNYFMLAVSLAHGGSEGFYQGGFTFQPGATYTLTVLVRTQQSGMHNGLVCVSLYNGGNQGVNFPGNCQDPVPGPRRDILSLSSTSFLGNWNKVSLTFTAIQGDQNYTQLMFWAGRGSLVDNEFVTVNFDCVSLVPVSCIDSWTITKPGYIIVEGLYQRNNFILINSNTPVGGALISPVNYAAVTLMAGHDITILPGFYSAQQSGCPFFCMIGTCIIPPDIVRVILDNNGCCGHTPQ